MLDVFVARQPIFDCDDRLVAYELLYRGNGRDNFAPVGTTSSTRMSADVLLQSVLGVGMERITGGKTAFVNVDRDILLSDPFGMLAPQGTVIELLESIACDAETVAASEALVSRGFTLALDDFVYDPSFDPLLRLAKIVKVDVLNRTPEELAPIVERLRPFGVRLLAERVETVEVHRQCAALGFELFQGYFFAKPEVLARREIPSEQATIMRLLNLLRDSETSDLEVEHAFKADLALTYRLLRIVNSAALGGRGIDSIRHAIQLVGRQALHRWLALLMVSSLSSDNGVNNELVGTAMHRARLCELLGEATGESSARTGTLFIVGLFSLIDALLRLPMEDVLQRVDLATEVREALLYRRGEYAPLLRLVEAYERGSWDEVMAASTAAGIQPGQVSDLYSRGAVWAREKQFASAEE
ncbi:MAG TPA: HDOD domain-containing protein [Gemmatimonadaceae bacterium]|jgi:EAL and modified HD-GYP domain-containing signal transduction protein|nr:HDOD domain-containing protein [Gemmatimonadaceae bacterium]